MKPKFVALALLVLASFPLTALAADAGARTATASPAAATPSKGESRPTPAQQAQQARMKRCHEDARKKALKGDERKAFMGTCLKR